MIFAFRSDIIWSGLKILDFFANQIYGFQPATESLR